MAKSTLTLLIILIFLPFCTLAQRIQPQLGRGVVATTRTSGTSVTVSWRKLTNDPDSCTYNVYARAQGTSSYTKLNNEPLEHTNAVFTATQLPYNQEVAVTTIDKNGTESEKSVPFLYKKQDFKNLFVNIDFDKTVLTGDYWTTHILPADTDGDGEIDTYIVDRRGSNEYEDEESEDEEEDGENSEEDDSGTSSNLDHYLQAYRESDGKLLWTVQMGPNVPINSGQHDQVTVYDIDCDGKSEVIIRSSDGTRFWDSSNDTWGKYVFGGDKADVDGDGIVDYTVTTVKRNPPLYVSIIDASTGEEKTSCELNYDEVYDDEDKYSRDNRSDYMNSKMYYAMDGQYAIAFDGIHPMVMAKCLDRTSDGYHHDYVFAFTYDWVNGKPENFHHSFTWSRNDKTPWPAEFHAVRICDVDGDGVDEINPGGFSVSVNKGMVSSAGIGHGDRFNITDIDPERPGLEAYCIQQSSMLGQVFYDVRTGELIKEWYQASANDVGRGVAYDIDSTYYGVECYSFVSDYIYDAKGKNTGKTRPYPDEGVWWDGDLLRESVHQSGGSGYNSKLYVSTSLGSSRLIQFSSEASTVKVNGTSGSRPGFWGDIIGDWREEVFLMKQTSTTSDGFVGYTTEIESPYSITSLAEEPHYSLDCTTHGYYQSPDVGFYLGHGMPHEPIYPCVRTDLRYKQDWDFTSYDMTSSENYEDGKSLIFDISGNNTSQINLDKTYKPKSIYLMVPREHDYIFGGNGTFSGDMTLTKGLQGEVTFNNNLIYTGKTVISEGTLRVNGSIQSPVYLMARGTLAGNLTLNAPLYFEGALHYEGCRLMAGSDSIMGTMTLNNGMDLMGKTVYVESIIKTSTSEADRYVVNGDLNVDGQLIFSIKNIEDSLTPGTYTLLEYTGNFIGDTANVSLIGLDAVPYEIKFDAGKILLFIDTSRDPVDNILWSGSKSNLWNYLDYNFTIDNVPSRFVSFDAITFTDEAEEFNITVGNTVTPSSITFTNDSNTYILSGDGRISGTTSLIKNGTGELRIELENNDYTGQTLVNNGTLTITNIANGGKSCAIGATTSEEGNFIISNAKLKIDGDNESTDRIITITDTATIEIVNSEGSFTLNDLIVGDGCLIKEGPGRMTFNYAGAYGFNSIIVRGGTIIQGDRSTLFGQTGALMWLEGGDIKLRDNYNMSTIPQLNNTIIVAENTENSITGSFRSNIRGSISGKGSLTFISGGARNNVYADFSQFEGVLKTQGDECLIQDDASDMSRLTLQPLSSSYFSPSASEVKIGTLISEEKDCRIGGNVISVGYRNEDATFAGTLTCNTFNKYGTGTLSLTGTNSTSAIYVNEGTIQMRNFTDVLTSSSLVIKEGGTLTGRGTTQSILLYEGGTIDAGVDSNTTGTIKTKGNFIGYGGGTIVIKVSSSGNSSYTIEGTLRLSGDTIHLNHMEDRTFSKGDELTVFKVEGAFNSSSSWTISDDSYIWDDSQLLSTGKLIYKGTISGIDEIRSSEQSLHTVYNLNGILLKKSTNFDDALNGLPKGIYIVDGKRVIKNK